MDGGLTHVLLLPQPLTTGLQLSLSVAETVKMNKIPIQSPNTHLLNTLIKCCRNSDGIENPNT